MCMIVLVFQWDPVKGSCRSGRDKGDFQLIFGCFCLVDRTAVVVFNKDFQGHSGGQCGE